MDLKGRHFLTLKDYTPEEIVYLLDLAASYKEKKKKGILHDTLRGKNVALIFEKTSTRTRCSLKWQHMIWEWEQLILTLQDLRLVRKKVLPIQQEYWEECMKVLNIEVLNRLS